MQRPAASIHVQLDVVLWRHRGAERKRRPATRLRVPHRRRPLHAAEHPLHVVMRGAFGGLRAQRIVNALVVRVAAATREVGRRFRVLQFSVQNDHVHLVAEANDKRALTAGMRGLAVRFARAVNKVCGRRGRVWADRYHARTLTTPRAVRKALVNVLANHRKHGATSAALDACSSAAWFTGWRDDMVLTMTWPEVRRWWLVPPPTAAPQTWLAAGGWLPLGRIGVHESPRARG